MCRRVQVVFLSKYRSESLAYLSLSQNEIFEDYLSELVPVTSALPMQQMRAKREESSSSDFTLPIANAKETHHEVLLNITVIMLNRRTALLQWWPRNALIHKDIEIVFTPEFSK